MNTIFLNISNHPSNKWSAHQTEAALVLANAIVDLPPPIVNPRASTEEITNMAKQFVKALTNDITHAMVSTEYTFTVALISLLQKAGITCVAATTERIVHENNDGVKTSVFNFIQFREFQIL